MRTIRVAISCLLLIALVTSLIPVKRGNSEEPLSNRIVDYEISVRLDADKKKLYGTEYVTWTNPGNKPVKELYFHLYPNAFRSKDSTFMMESGGKLRRDNVDYDKPGEMTVKRVRILRGSDITSTLQYVQPDDQNENDQTVAYVTLPTTVEPGEKVTLNIEFVVTLPKVFARMGFNNDFVMAGQWFPKLAVYEPAGTRGVAEEGWNAHQYHGNSEFYADFGTYQVSINVPSNYIVAATGFPVGDPKVEEDGSQTWKYAANDVHDFAWSASSEFVYAERSYSSENVPGTKIKLYMDPATEPLKDRYFKAATETLNQLSEWLGEYPYSTLSIVIPPAGAGGAAGMEYPTLITAWDASDSKPGESLERVVVHEIAHQYWYGMVATNEFEEAWLDEGFTSYVEDKIMERSFRSMSFLPFEATTILTPEPLAFPAWHYQGYQSYASNVYLRAKLVLNGIEGLIGEKQMRSVMRAYFQKWRFDHPNTRDFQSVVEEVTGRDWTAYFNDYVYGAKMVDYSVKDIRTRTIQKDGKTQYESLVFVEQLGGPYEKVPIQFGLANGTKQIHQWNGKQQQVRFRIVDTSPVTWARIDPDLSIVLENRRWNNFLRASIKEEDHRKWTSYGTNALQWLFQSIGW